MYSMLQEDKKNSINLEVGISPISGITLCNIIDYSTEIISQITWSRNGKFLAFITTKGRIYIWNDIIKDISQKFSLMPKSCNISWFPDEETIISDPYAGCFHFWKVSTGSISNRIENQGINGNGVVCSPDGKIIALPTSHGTVSLWNTITGLPYTNPINNSDRVLVIAFSADSRLLASGYRNGTIKILDIEKSSLLEMPKGHRSKVNSISWSPDSRFFASASDDHLVHIWDMELLKLHKSLEAHTDIVTSVSYSFDGRLLASKSLDNTVRIWRCDTWQIVATLDESTGTSLGASLAFHPCLPRLATLSKNMTIIHIWDLDMDVLLGNAAVNELLHYTTARIVLVGDSGVGKTGLGWRLAHGNFIEHASTHGQQFWIVEDLKMQREDGTECEAVIWDLAGQHVYRSVHAIFLNDVDLALVLFDPTNRQEPLKGVQFWLEQLSSQKKIPPTILVGARSDRGAPVLSQQDLEHFCQRFGVGGNYLSTSAKSGEGLNQLLEIIKTLIKWDNITATITTVNFKRIKEFVLDLKEQPDRKNVLVRPGDLCKQIREIDGNWQFSDAETMTAVKHLESHGYVSILRNSSGEEYILLVPELLVGLASSIVLQADKHPRELGSLSETTLMQAGYLLPELALLEQKEQQVLLDAAAARFLAHNICFRETLGLETLLIFPALIKQKRPLLDDIETMEDISYIVRGRVENVYAALVVLLGYTQTFTRVNQWQHQAQYELGPGEICGFRLIEEREGEIELVLYYSAAIPMYGRALFQGLFEKFLYQRDVDVISFPRVICQNHHYQERATVVKRMREGKNFLFCEECGDRIALPKIETPLVLGLEENSWVRREQAQARLRSTYETHLVRVKGFRRDRAIPRCYISCTLDQRIWVETLADDLREAGVFIISELDRVSESDCVILVDTPNYRKNYLQKDAMIADDIALINMRLERVKNQKIAIIIILRESESNEPLIDIPHLDFRSNMRYIISLFNLILALYAIPQSHPAFEPLRKSLNEQWQQTLPSPIDQVQFNNNLNLHDTEEQDHIYEVLAIKQRHLRILERQAAQYGIDCPPHIVQSVEDLRREIQQLQIQIKQ